MLKAMQSGLQWAAYVPAFLPYTIKQRQTAPWSILFSRAQGMVMAWVWISMEQQEWPAMELTFRKFLATIIPVLPKDGCKKEAALSRSNQIPEHSQLKKIKKTLVVFRTAPPNRYKQHCSLLHHQKQVLRNKTHCQVPEKSWNQC